MNIHQSIAIRAIAIAFALTAAGAAHASRYVQSQTADADPARRCSELTGLDARIVEKSAQGVDALRRYILMTRDIYGLDMRETMAWLDRERAARSSCPADAAAIPVR